MASGEKGDPGTLADRALELATSFLESATNELKDLSSGDLGALLEASRIIRGRAAAPGSVHDGEHLAFSLITAAHSELVSGGGETDQI